MLIGYGRRCLLIELYYTKNNNKKMVLVEKKINNFFARALSTCGAYFTFIGTIEKIKKDFQGIKDCFFLCLIDRQNVCAINAIGGNGRKIFFRSMSFTFPVDTFSSERVKVFFFYCHDHEKRQTVSDLVSLYFLAVWQVFGGYSI